MKIIIKNSEQIGYMREGGRILAAIVKKLALQSVEGVSTMFLDKQAAKLISDFDVRSAFLGYEGYEYNTCLSVNDVVVHGLPSESVVLKKGDILKIDAGIYFHGMITDHAVSVIVGGETTDARNNLFECSKKALMNAISGLKDGSNLTTITNKINDTADVYGFQPVRELVGHGVGLRLHEDPNISCYRGHALDIELKEGMTLAIETMINEKGWKCKTDKDGWTMRTADGGDSAMFEHTVVITKKGAEILTI
ncbi:MAG: type I methionyl aminopeptidase [bacterium]